MAKRGPKSNGPARQLRKAKFVEAFLKSGEGGRAAEAAGYAPSGAKIKANELLKQPDVQAKIAEASKEMSRRGIFNLEIAMEKTNDAIQFAIDTGNANAYVKALELQAKMNGLLIERVEHSGSGFNVIINGITKPPEIDITPVKPELPYAPTEEEELLS